MIGDNIKDFRVKKNITQQELAEKLNVTRQAISKWENNKGEPDLNMLRNIATALSVTVEELIDGECTVQIQAIIRETQPALRFIGKRYNGNESIRTKWKLWKENGWFSILKGLDNRYGNNYIGAKRIVNGSLEYWIGMFFLSNTNIPDGFEYIDIAEVNLAAFQLRGKAHKVTSFETHNLCLDELDKNGMTRFEDYWCFECFDDKSINDIGTEKMASMVYKISIL